MKHYDHELAADLHIACEQYRRKYARNPSLLIFNDAERISYHDAYNLAKIPVSFSPAIQCRFQYF